MTQKIENEIIQELMQSDKTFLVDLETFVCVSIAEKSHLYTMA